MFDISKITLILFITMFIFACKNENLNVQMNYDNNIIATIGSDTINLHEVDSMASEQIFNIRMQALEILMSNKILSAEAEKQEMTLEKLVENKINKLSYKVNDKDISNYIRRENISYIDTNSIISYLTLIKQKQRQEEYTDSLKQEMDIKVLLMPSGFKEIDTSGIYFYNLNNTKSDNIVYIISDFKCGTCRIAEYKLKKMYKKYNNRVEFRFVYHSSYIDKPSLACEAANNQKAFTEMHHKLFAVDIFNDENVYLNSAKELNLNIEQFKRDMNNNSILKKLTNNSELLISKEIYSTPSFIVNKKLIDGKYAVDYLEKVINDEFIK